VGDYVRKKNKQGQVLFKLKSFCNSRGETIPKGTRKKPGEGEGEARDGVEEGKKRLKGTPLQRKKAVIFVGGTRGDLKRKEIR